MDQDREPSGRIIHPKDGNDHIFPNIFPEENISTPRNLEFELENCTEGTSDRRYLKKGEESMPSEKGNEVAKAISVNSSDSSDSGQAHDKGCCACVTGVNEDWHGALQNRTMLSIQTTFQDMHCKTESSSSNSIQILLPTCSNISVQETSTVNDSGMKIEKSSPKSLLPLSSDKGKMCLEVAQKVAREEQEEVVTDAKERNELHLSPVKSRERASLSKLDLNEDIWIDEGECLQQLVKVRQTTSSYGNCSLSRPTPIFAKLGIPIRFPAYQLQLEGEIDGWKGSSPTSAFQPTQTFKRRSKQSKAIGIDLNLVASEGDMDVELNRGKSVPPLLSFLSEESSVEVSSTLARRPNIDLNFCSENEDNCREPSPPTSSSRHFVTGFDLNSNPRYEQPNRGNASSRNCPSDLKGVRPTFWSDWSNMQAFSHKPFMITTPNMPMVHSLLPILAYRPSPSSAFIYNNGFYVDLNNSPASNIYSANLLPYMTDPFGVPVMPRVLGTEGPYHMEHPWGAGPSPGPGPGPGSYEFSMARSSSDLNSGVTAAARYESRGATNVIRPLLGPVNSSTLEHHILSFPRALPMKRSEPEAGLDSNKLVSL